MYLPYVVFYFYPPSLNTEDLSVLLANVLSHPRSRSSESSDSGSTVDMEQLREQVGQLRNYSFIPYFKMSFSLRNSSPAH